MDGSISEALLMQEFAATVGHAQPSSPSPQDSAPKGTQGGEVSPLPNFTRLDLHRCPHLQAPWGGDPVWGLTLQKPGAQAHRGHLFREPSKPTLESTLQNHNR